MIKPWVRQVLFWSFLTFFVIAAPAIVLYTAGYRYNFKNGQIVRTGVISVSSTPRNAKIYLDGNDTEKETPFVFKRIMPDVYEVSIWRE
ncbi:PEGA domain-containing protein, partial [Patescibacteria group bacterium]|nr:PEGA domain-containing protein [Patescibacteria group bacterium]